MDWDDIAEAFLGALLAHLVILVVLASLNARGRYRRRRRWSR